MGLLNKIRDLIRSQEGPDADRVDLGSVEKILQYDFQEKGLLLLALTHRSFSRFDHENTPSNERLEFLGDSVLGLVIAEQLFKDNPGVREGDLTKTKAMLVNETTLALIATRIGLNRYLRLSPEEERSGGKERTSIVSDAFASIIAAVYLDGGLDAARHVILGLIYARRRSILSDDAQRNFKGELLEYTQGKGEGMPRYEVISETGPDHEKEFRVVVSVGDNPVGEGLGSSKKEAEQKAAAEALAMLTGDNRTNS